MAFWKKKKTIYLAPGNAHPTPTATFRAGRATCEKCTGFVYAAHVNGSICMVSNWFSRTLQKCGMTLGNLEPEPRIAKTRGKPLSETGFQLVFRTLKKCGMTLGNLEPKPRLLADTSCRWLFVVDLLADTPCMWLFVVKLLADTSCT